jgi:hypothetical protein
MRLYRLALLIPVFALAGCHSGILPNPNDPLDGQLTVDNIRDQLGCISDALLSRESRGQITDAEYHERKVEAANSLLRGFNPDKIDISKGWQVGEILITAKRWSQAKKVLEGAVELAKIRRNEDRRINDSLRLAQVLAEMGDVPGAVKMARTAFKVQPQDAVPVLNATLLRIVPAGRGKGHDLELAKLLEDAIAVDQKAMVDTESAPGKSYLMARPFHEGKSWKLIAELYDASKRPDLADAARLKTKGTQVNDPGFEGRIMRDQRRFKRV